MILSHRAILSRPENERVREYTKTFISILPFYAVDVDILSPINVSTS